MLYPVMLVGVNAISKKQRGAIGYILPMSFIMLINEFISYLGDVAFAYLYGTSAASDAYLAAAGMAMLPGMLISSCVSVTFMPLYMGQSELERDGFASNILSLLLILAVALCALAQVFAQPVLKFMNPGFDAERLSLALELSRIMIPSIILMSVSMVLSTLLEARNRFSASALSMLPRSILMILSSVLFAPVYGIKAIAVGALAASAVQMVILALSSRKVFSYRPIIGIREPYLKKMLALSGPAIIGMGVNNIARLVSRAIASGLNVGDMSAMSSAFQLTNLINAVFVIPVITVAFPRLSASAAGGDKRKVMEMALRYASAITIFLIPVILLGMAAHQDIVRLAYGRGMFGSESVRITSGVFFYQLPGLLFTALRMILTSAFHALQDTRTPLYTGCIAALINIGLCYLLVGGYGVSGLSLASTITGAVSAALMAAALSLKVRARPGDLAVGAAAR